MGDVWLFLVGLQMEAGTKFRKVTSHQLNRGHLGLIILPEMFNMVNTELGVYF